MTQGNLVLLEHSLRISGFEQQSSPVQCSEEWEKYAMAVGLWGKLQTSSCTHKIYRVTENVPTKFKLIFVQNCWQCQHFTNVTEISISGNYLLSSTCCPFTSTVFRNSIPKFNTTLWRTSVVSQKVAYDIQLVQSLSVALVTLSLKQHHKTHS
jgi:hypothetical protein